MEDWIIRLVEWAGYWGVALLMLIETVFPPVPSEVIMTVAGVSASRGHMTLAGTIAAGTAGAMLGNWFWYWLAIKFGEKRMNGGHFCNKEHKLHSCLSLKFRNQMHPTPHQYLGHLASVRLHTRHKF